MPRGCGACNACCKLVNVPDIGKPAHMLCWWTGIHGGCSQQHNKPNPEKVHYNPERDTWTVEESEHGKDWNLLACAQFECMWLNSQKRADPGEVWPRHWRPDISHIMVAFQDPDDVMLVHVHVDPTHPTAWRESELFDFFQRQMTEKGVRYEIHLGEQRFALEPV